MNRGMESMGPGRYRAMMAVMSSMFWGFRPTHTPVMPADSIWNTPEVLPSDSIWNTAGSSSGIFFGSKSGWLRRTSLAASSSTVRFRRPKKSIFKRPSSSRVVMTYWVTTDSSFFARGT